MNGFCRCWFDGISGLFWYLFITGNVMFYGTVAHLILFSDKLPSGILISTTWILLVSSWLYSTVLPMSFVFVNMQSKETRVAILFTVVCIVVIGLCVIQILLTYNSTEISQDETMQEYLVSRIDEYAKANYQYPLWLTKTQQNENCCGLNGPSDFGITLPLIENIMPDSCQQGVQTGCLEAIKNQLKTYALLIQIISGVILFNAVVTMFAYLIHFLSIKSQPMIVLGSVLVRMDHNNNMERLDMERICITAYQDQV